VSDETASAATGGDVATARAKYHCPACGAEANWDPAKQALVCPFCGTTSPATLETLSGSTVIVEHDLVEALRNIPDSARGWQVEKTSVRCQSCQAISVLDPDKVGGRCAFCGSAQLVPYTQVKEAFSPESLLPLKVSEAQARDAIRGWYKRQWLAPSALNRRALTDTVKGVYLPYWTFDAQTHATWTAESGTHYYTTDSKGNRQQHTTWTPAAGELSHVFDDMLVPASRGIRPDYLHSIEPFPTGALIPYDPGYLSGWTVERYQIDLVGAAEESRRKMQAALEHLCGEQVPGDTYRNLQVNATYRDQRFKHILVPVWLMSYLFGRTSYQVLINGVTGSIAGGRPWSWIKVTLLVLAIAIVVLTVLYLDNSN
jgi:DNA-directed RNA polymerase subunit RPC12/RpoP